MKIAVLIQCHKNPKQINQMMRNARPSMSETMLRAMESIKH